VLAVLALMGAQEAGARIDALWHGYLAASGETKPADYEVCYPQALIESLARYAVAGCRALGLRAFNQIVDPSRPDDIPALLGEAWERFLTDSQAYASWERQRLQGLWQELDCGRSPGLKRQST
jgi:hypothetical protein